MGNSDRVVRARSPSSSAWVANDCHGLQHSGGWRHRRWRVLFPRRLDARGGLAFCLFHSSLIHMQDLRDVDVDAAAGRVTFPILLGDTLTRWLIVPVLSAVSYMMTFVGRESLADAGITTPFEAVMIE
ncbi:hypothetical protein BC936DRAFT_137836 [Jimgerdemannia flammicorona]|uniref:Uncharacterized protein n=1 Tax=Jimgerdemannia flammicorona TaxID=994334 RepID=A0A433CWK8_9FUNG|nr:hypothetical protein BC936DRAFT_137836 [Jimgerdemannia flammicorona]